MGLSKTWDNDIVNDSMYDINRKSEKLFAKLKSIERFNHKTGFSKDRDIHHCLWEERVILEVGAIDLDSKRCEIINPINKMSCIIDINELEFCNKDGSRRSVKPTVHRQ